MDRELAEADRVCDPGYNSSKNENLFIEPNYAFKGAKSANLLSNTLEIMDFNDDSNDSENFSCSSHLSDSESDKNKALSCHVINEMRSTRKKLTFEWIKTMSCEYSQYEFSSNFDFSANSNSDVFQTDSETDDSSENECVEASPRSDDSIIFMEDSNDSNSSELTFCFADIVTEKNFDSGFSSSTRGSLTNCIEDDFLEDSDFELVFSTPLSADSLPGWNDIVSEASELSQGFENKAFVDLFDVSAKFKVLKKVNERWESDMCDIDEKPRESVKVTFAPLPDLVTVHLYQKDEKDHPCDTSVLDRIRFKNRIEESSRILSPILTLEHRTNIISRYCLYPLHD